MLWRKISKVRIKYVLLVTASFCKYLDIEDKAWISTFLCSVTKILRFISGALPTDLLVLSTQTEHVYALTYSNSCEIQTHAAVRSSYTL